MNYTRTKIIAEPVEVFVAERTSETTPTALPSLAEVNAGGSATWKFFGATPQKGAKLPTDPYSATLADGTSAQLGMKITGEAIILYTDDATITLIEGFIDKCVDVIFRVVGGSKVYRLLRTGVVYKPELVFDTSEGNKITVTFQRDAKRYSDACSTATLA